MVGCFAWGELTWNDPKLCTKVKHTNTIAEQQNKTTLGVHHRQPLALFE